MAAAATATELHAQGWLPGARCIAVPGADCSFGNPHRGEQLVMLQFHSAGKREKEKKIILLARSPHLSSRLVRHMVWFPPWGKPRWRLFSNLRLLIVNQVQNAFQDRG